MTNQNRIRNEESENKPIIMRVCKNISSVQKIVTIPQRCKNIKPGDYVVIKKIKLTQGREAIVQ